MPMDPLYFLMLAPAILLGIWAQMKVQSTFAQSQRLPARLSGAEAARYILDSAGVRDVGIETTPGQLSDHYDPRRRVLRLSPAVYQTRSLAAVGIAAHEAGHALQHAQNYVLLGIRNGAVPAAQFGPTAGALLIVFGAMLAGGGVILGKAMLWLGLALYTAFVFFQLVNLPVEFDASRRAREQLVRLGLVSSGEIGAVKQVLDAAAWTYVAATLTAILTLFYYLLRLGLLGGRRDDRE